MKGLAASIGLMYAVGVRVFASARFGVVPAALFVLTPLLWRQSQNAPASLNMYEPPAAPSAP